VPRTGRVPQPRQRRPPTVLVGGLLSSLQEVRRLPRTCRSLRSPTPRWAATSARFRAGCCRINSTAAAASSWVDQSGYAGPAVRRRGFVADGRTSGSDVVAQLELAAGVSLTPFATGRTLGFDLGPLPAGTDATPTVVTRPSRYSTSAAETGSRSARYPCRIAVVFPKRRCAVDQGLTHSVGATSR
jgi:hypothetical protein